MKHLRNFESHRKSEKINEEIFGAIGKLLGGFFRKMGENIRKTKGGKEVEAIYTKYLQLIDDNLKKTANLDLNLVSADKAAKIKESRLVLEADETEADKKAAQTNAKMSADTLRAKKSILDQVLKKFKEMALKEMDEVLRKVGGAVKNPDLNIIINTKKDQFELDFLNAKIAYLETSGDKTLLPQIQKERDGIAKKIELAYKDFGTKKPVEYKEGDLVIYLLQGKTKDQWDPNKKPEEQTGIVAVNKISKIEGDKFKLLDKEGKETIEKTEGEILGKVETPIEVKVGDKIQYNKKDGTVADAEVIDTSDPDIIRVKTETNTNGFAIARSKIVK